MHRCHRFALGLAFLLASSFFAPAAFAEAALQVEPGKWKTRTEMKSTMSPQPRVTERTECVTDGEWDADTFMKDSATGCTFSDVQSSASRLQWKVTCDSHAGRMTGAADYRSTGENVEGTMHMAMNAGGMAIEMGFAFEGERLGDCD